MRNVEEALIEGALLTVLVVFLFLNSWRSTVITGLALPVSVLSAFIAVWAFGFTLNTMSLLGLSLAIGILIDDAIVVRENIVRHVEMGKDHMTAALEGTDEIAWRWRPPPSRSWRCSCRSRSWRGSPGQWFKPFALTIACSVLVSLFVSFSLDPMLSAYWPDPQIEAHERQQPDRPRARPLQPVVRPPGRALQEGHRLGARPPAGRHRHRRGVVLRRHRAAGLLRRRRLHPGERPLRDQRWRWRRRRARTSTTPRSRRGEVSNARPHAPGGAYTYTTIGSPRLGRRRHRQRLRQA